MIIFSKNGYKKRNAYFNSNFLIVKIYERKIFSFAEIIKVTFFYKCFFFKNNILVCFIMLTEFYKIEKIIEKIK